MVNTFLNTWWIFPWQTVSHNQMVPMLKPHSSRDPKRPWSPAFFEGGYRLPHGRHTEVGQHRAVPRGSAGPRNGCGSQITSDLTNKEAGIHVYIVPIGSMYGIYANIGGILMVNVTIYGIHGSYGLCTLSYIYMDQSNM